MKQIANGRALVLLACSVLCGACQKDQPQRVVFADSKPIGSWYTADSAGAQSPTPSDKPSAGADDDDDQPSQALDGSDGMTSSNTNDGAAGAGGAAGAAANGAGAGGAAGGTMPSTPAGDPIAVSFEFTTKVVHPGKLDKNGTCIVPNPSPLPKSCWGPENAGAVWVETPDGHFVKTLEVWAKSRRQNLVAYAAAHGDMAIDVTASASRVKDLTTGDVPNDPHQDMWLGVDRGGKVAPAGKYVMQVELSDCDAADDPTCKNALLEVPFDTAMHGSVPVMDMTFFTGIKLSVQ